MTKKEKDGENSRRDFLKLATVAAPAAVASVTGKTADAEEIDQQSGSGMRDTAHTRAYFDSARF